MEEAKKTNNEIDTNELEKALKDDAKKENEDSKSTLGYLKSFVKDNAGDIIGLVAAGVAIEGMDKLLAGTILPVPKQPAKKIIYFIGMSAINDLVGSYAWKGSDIIVTSVTDNIKYIRESWKKSAEKTTV